MNGFLAHDRAFADFSCTLYWRRSDVIFGRQHAWRRCASPSAGASAAGASAGACASAGASAAGTSPSASAAGREPS